MEVLLVLAILVILGSLVTVGYMQMQKNANINAARSQIGMLEGAVQSYALAHRHAARRRSRDWRPCAAAPSDLKNPAKWAGPVSRQEQLPHDPWGNPISTSRSTPRTSGSGRTDPTASKAPKTTSIRPRRTGSSRSSLGPTLLTVRRSRAQSAINVPSQATRPALGTWTT